MCSVFCVAFKAPRRPAGGVSVPVPALVGVSRCSGLQEGFPQPARSSAQVAKRVRRRTHCCALPVSNLVHHVLEIKIQSRKMFRLSRKRSGRFNYCCWRLTFKSKSLFAEGSVTKMPLKTWRIMTTSVWWLKVRVTVLYVVSGVVGAMRCSVRCFSIVVFCTVENPIAVWCAALWVGAVCGVVCSSVVLSPRSAHPLMNMNGLSSLLLTHHTFILTTPVQKHITQRCHTVLPTTTREEIMEIKSIMA